MSKDIGVHTIDIKHKISAYEARNLKQIFEVSLNDKLCTTKLYPKGLNELEIKENPVYKNGSLIKTTYDLCLQINVSRLLGASEVLMTVMNSKTMKKAVNVLNKIFSKDLGLSIKNSSAEDWTLSRLDCGFDLTLPPECVQDGIYMRLLHHALNLHNSRQCRIIGYKGSEEKEVLYESLRFGNDSYTYNIYLKYKQMLDKYGEKAEKHKGEIENTLRVEKQIFGKGIAHYVGSPQKLSLLLDDTVKQKLMQSVVKEIRLFFGEGDFMSYARIKERIGQSIYNDEHKKMLCNMSAAISKEGYEDFCKCLETDCKEKGADFNERMGILKQYRQDLEALGVSVSGILKGEAEDMGLDTLQGLYEQVKPDAPIPAAKGKKGKFGKLIWNDKENRYKCNFTIHSIREGNRRIAMADRDKEKLKLEIFKKLAKVYKENAAAVTSGESTLLGLVDKSRQDIELFKEVIGLPDFQIKIDKQQNMKERNSLCSILEL